MNPIEIEIEHTGVNYDQGQRFYWLEARFTNPLNQATTVSVAASRNHISDELGVEICDDLQAEAWLEAIVVGYREIPDIFNAPRHIEARANDEEARRHLLGILAAIPE